jgi:hypothetical protein
MTPQTIYHCIRKYNPIVERIPQDDVIQEIKIAIFLTQDEKCLLKNAANAVYNLLCQYGYSKKMGKDNFSFFYADRISDEEIEIIEKIDEIYRGNNYTSRQIAKMLNIEHSNKFAKILHQCFPKQLGLGGARVGAGKRKN